MRSFRLDLLEPAFVSSCLATLTLQSTHRRQPISCRVVALAVAALAGSLGRRRLVVEAI